MKAPDIVLCVDRSALSYERSKLRDEWLVESAKDHFKLLDQTCS